MSRQISQNVLHISWPTLQVWYLVGVLVGMIFQIFVWQSPKGRCYGNQSNVGDVRKRHLKWPLLFALAFDNGLADRKSAFKRFNANNHATSYRNLLNFCPVISEFTLLKRPIFAAIWRRSSFVTLAFPNGFDDRNFDFSVAIGNHFCTPYRNLVRFGSVTPEFKT